MDLKPFVIGIGGASCSGKTTLAKHLADILPNSLLIYQDDYAPDEKEIPIHPVHGIRDWDSAPTAVKWEVFQEDLFRVRKGVAPANSATHEHLDLLTLVPLCDEVKLKWREAFKSSKRRFIVVEGFVLFWNTRVNQLIDLKFFLRSDKDVLRQRRLERNDRIAVDSYWKDPPDIFDKIVWPAYESAYATYFVDRNVETGALSAGQDLHLLEITEHGMDRAADHALHIIQAELRQA